MTEPELGGEWADSVASAPRRPAIPRLDDDDWALSMRTSNRARHDPDNQVSLRSMLVHRLTVSFKAVLRRPLREPRDRIGMYCEQCDKWIRIDGWPEVTQCPRCAAVYRMEMAVYEQVDADDL